MKLWPFSKKDKAAGTGKFELPPGVMLADPNEPALSPDFMPQPADSHPVMPSMMDQPAAPMPAPMPEPTAQAFNFEENAMPAYPPLQPTDEPFTLTSDMMAPPPDAQPAGEMFRMVTPPAEMPPVAGAAGAAAVQPKPDLNNFFEQNSLSLISPTEPATAQETSDVLDFLTPPASPQISMPGAVQAQEPPRQTSAFPDFQVQTAAQPAFEAPAKATWQPASPEAPAESSWQPSGPEASTDFLMPPAPFAPEGPIASVDSAWQPAPDAMLPPAAPEPMAFDQPMPAFKAPQVEAPKPDLLASADVFEFAPEPQPRILADPMAPPALSVEALSLEPVQAAAPDLSTEWTMPDLSAPETVSMNNGFLLSPDADAPVAPPVDFLGYDQAVAEPADNLGQTLMPEPARTEVSNFYGMGNTETVTEEASNGFYGLSANPAEITATENNGFYQSSPDMEAEADTVFSLDFPGDDAPSASVLEFAGSVETGPVSPESGFAEEMTAYDTEAPGEVFDFSSGAAEDELPATEAFAIEGEAEMGEAGWDEDAETGMRNALNHEDYDLNHYPDPDEEAICLDLDAPQSVSPEPVAMPEHHVEAEAESGGFEIVDEVRTYQGMDHEELAPFALAEEFRADSSYYEADETEAETGEFTWEAEPEAPAAAAPEAEPAVFYQEPVPTPAETRPELKPAAGKSAAPQPALQKPAREKKAFTWERQEMPPQYTRSMADALDSFERETILNESRFLHKSINDLVDRYFAQSDEESAS